MQAGLLTGKFTKERSANLPESDWRSRNPIFNEPQLSVNLQAIDQLREIADTRGISLAQLSLAWVLRLEEMTSAIVGARKPQQIEETAQAGGIQLTPKEMDGIEEILAWRTSMIQV